MFTAAVMGCVLQLVIKENDDDDDVHVYFYILHFFVLIVSIKRLVTLLNYNVL